MSKPKSFLLDIPKLYRSQTIDAVLYGYVTAAQEIDPKMSITKACENFLDKFGLTAECDTQLAVQMFARVRDAYRENRSVL